MPSMIRLVNLPWMATKKDVSIFLSELMSARVRFTRIIYDQNTGLSRGIALVAMQEDRVNLNLLKKGTLDYKGRTVKLLEGYREKPLLPITSDQ